VDAAIVAVATFAVFGVLVMDRYLTDPTLSTTGRVISVCYPVMDVALIAVAVRLIGSVHLRRPAFALLLGGLCSLLVADMIYGILNSAGVFSTGGVADVFWLGFYVLLASAALHPDMAKPPQEHRQGLLMTRPGIAALCLTTLAVPTIDLLWGRPVDQLLTTICSSLLFLLVIVRLLGLVGVIQRNERRARHDASHDALTGLANRVLFGQRVDEAGRGRPEGIVAVLFIDLDDFKSVNDSLGHEQGDQLLTTVAARLRGCVRDGDLVARISGDEFAVLVESAVDREDAVVAARRVQEALALPFSAGDRNIIVTASIGITVEDVADFPGTDELLRSADAAMYHAKAAGKGRYEFFAPEMRQAALERLELKGDLQVALERGEFEVYFQPIVRLSDRRIISVEALLRWHHPTRGLVTPNTFVPLAEQTGLIQSIGRWVLLQACEQVAHWQRRYPGTAPQQVSVNLSVMQLHTFQLVGDVADALARSGLDPAALTLQITESMLLAKTTKTLATLNELKALRVRIGIDDFGTGYSALAYLRHFPIDVLKIDRSFVQEIGTSATSRSLVAAVVELARALEIDTVAEGIEDEAQVAELTAMQCSAGQGYLFSIPLPARRAEVLFLPARESHRSAHASTGALETVLVAGQHDIDAVAADLELLHFDLGKPLMATWTWLRPWTSVHRDWDPVAVVVRERGGPLVEAAALLAVRSTGGVTELIAIGRGPLQCTRLASRSDRGARLLAKGITELLPRGPALDPGPARAAQRRPGGPAAGAAAARGGDHPAAGDSPGRVPPRGARPRRAQRQHAPAAAQGRQPAGQRRARGAVRVHPGRHRDPASAAGDRAGARRPRPQHWPAQRPGRRRRAAAVAPAGPGLRRRRPDRGLHAADRRRAGRLRGRAPGRRRVPDLRRPRQQRLRTLLPPAGCWRRPCWTGRSPTAATAAWTGAPGWPARSCSPSTTPSSGPG
jgi:diguanylate cyclase (GGDEF)-like protein